MALDLIHDAVPLGVDLSNAGKPAANKDAGAAMEELFARTLVQELRRALPEEGLFGGEGGEIWQDLFDDAMAQALIDQGAFRGAIPTSASDHTVGTADPEPQLPPMPVAGARVSSQFGWRQHPIFGTPDHHEGVDYAAPTGTPIRAVAAGTVKIAEERPGYGLLVVVDHGGGLETRYAHCDRFDVREGDPVQAGEVIAEVGSTGNSTGPHLHFEVRKRGVAVDPQAWLGKPLGRR